MLLFIVRFRYAYIKTYILQHFQVLRGSQKSLNNARFGKRELDESGEEEEIPLKRKRSGGIKHLRKSSVQDLLEVTRIQDIIPQNRKLIILDANDSLDHCLMVPRASFR